MFLTLQKFHVVISCAALCTKGRTSEDADSMKVNISDWVRDSHPSRCFCHLLVLNINASVTVSDRRSSVRVEPPTPISPQLRDVTVPSEHQLMCEASCSWQGSEVTVVQL